MRRGIFCDTEGTGDIVVTSTRRNTSIAAIATATPETPVVAAFTLILIVTVLLGRLGLAGLLHAS